MRLVFILVFFGLAGLAQAQTVLASRAIRSRTVVTADMVVLDDSTTIGAFAALEAVIGLEARVNIYPGRPVMFEDLGSPAIIERNQVVTLLYRHGALLITTEGRVLDRAGIGDRVRVMNLDSRAIVFGRVTDRGMIEVGL